MLNAHSVGFLLLTLMGVLFTGCDGIGHRYCAAVVRPAVTVDLVQAATGAPVADSALGVLRDGSSVDSMRVHVPAKDGESTSVEGGLGRAGTYEVRVEADGFAPWTRSDVAVSDGECSVNTPELTARLSGADGGS